MQQNYDLQWETVDVDNLRISFSGSIAIDNAGKILEQCKQIVKNSTAKNICWDLARVKYLGSYG